MTITGLRIHRVSLLRLLKRLVKSPCREESVGRIEYLLIHNARILGMCLSLVGGLAQSCLHISVCTCIVTASHLVHRTCGITVHLMRKRLQIVIYITLILGRIAHLCCKHQHQKGVLMICGQLKTKTRLGKHYVADRHRIGGQLGSKACINSI